MSIRRVWLTAIAVLLGSASFVSSGSATTYKFTESGTSNFGDSAAGFGTVDVVTVGSDLQFTFNLNSGVWFVDTGTHNAVTFNLATGGLAFSGLSGLFTGANAGGYSNPGFNSSYNYAVTCSGPGANSCGASHPSTLSFLILGGAGLQPLLTDGVYVTADVFNSAATGREKTGAIGATLLAAPVPGPVVGAGIPGLVMAFSGFLAWRRRRRQLA